MDKRFKQAANKPLIEALRIFKWYLWCSHCGSKLYKYTGPKKPKDDEIIMAEYFKPVNSKIPQPIYGGDMFCPICKGVLAHE
jgi:hypothetical protein